jgi:hypothetical protein
VLFEPTWSMRLVVNMRINGYSFQQAGERLGITRQAAHQLFHRYFAVCLRRDTKRIEWLKRKQAALEMAIGGLRKLILLDVIAQPGARDK